MTTTLPELQNWVDSVAKHTCPDNIRWCSGTDDEYQEFVEQMLGDGTLTKLNEKTYPNCYLHRSDPDRRRARRAPDLRLHARPRQMPVRTTTGWRPAKGTRKMDALFDGCMRGRTMYVIPYCMGPIDSPYCALRRRDHRQPLCRRQHAADDAHGRPRRWRASSATAPSSRACTRSATSIPNAASSCISRKNSRSRASAPATAATRCWARNAMRCASPAGRRARKAGWPSTC